MNGCLWQLSAVDNEDMVTNSVVWHKAALAPLVTYFDGHRLALFGAVGESDNRQAFYRDLACVPIANTTVNCLRDINRCVQRNCVCAFQERRGNDFKRLIHVCFEERFARHTGKETNLAIAQFWKVVGFISNGFKRPGTDLQFHVIGVMC